MIIHSGAAAHRSCQEIEPTILAVDLRDWAELDVTVGIVEAAMHDNDLCGTLAVDVHGPGCVRPASRY